MKKFEFNNNKQVRIRKIIQELEKILDDLVLEILKKRELNIGKKVGRGRKEKKFRN
jgi:hypothetical protein